MQKIIYSFLFTPIIYSAFMLAKSPTVSDAIITLVLGTLAGFLFYINAKYYNSVRKDTEASKLEEELKVERLKVSIEQAREMALREKSIRDSRVAAMTHERGGEFKF